MGEHLGHLFKGSSGRKHKCTQFLTPFLSTGCHALAHGMTHFVRSVSFKNLEVEVSDVSVEVFQPMR